MKYNTVNVCITDISIGDYVLHNRRLRQVTSKDIKCDAIHGRSIFNDTYKYGYKPVKLVIFKGKRR